MTTTDPTAADVLALLAEATPGEWMQGRLLSTEVTRRFSFEQRADFSDIEKGTIYVNFSAADEGRSRSRILLVDNGLHAHANAAAIVAAVNYLRSPAFAALLAENERLRDRLVNLGRTAQAVIDAAVTAKECDTTIDGEDVTVLEQRYGTIDKEKAQALMTSLNAARAALAASPP